MVVTMGNSHKRVPRSSKSHALFVLSLLVLCGCASGLAQESTLFFSVTVATSGNLADINTNEVVGALNTFVAGQNSASGSTASPATTKLVSLQKMAAPLGEIRFTFTLSGNGGVVDSASCRRLSRCLSDVDCAESFQGAISAAAGAGTSVSSLSVLPAPPAGTQFVATFANRSFTSAAVEAAVNTLFNLTRPVQVTVVGTPWQLHDDDRSSIVEFVFAKSPQALQLDVDAATTLLNQCVGENASATCLASFRALLATSAANLTSLTTASASVAPPTPPTPQSWIAREPEAFAAMMALIVALGVGAALYAFRVRERQSERLREASEAMNEHNGDDELMQTHHSGTLQEV